MSGCALAAPDPGTTCELYDTWTEARRRLDQVQLAGYRAQVVNCGDCGVAVTIFKGKHADLSRLPR